MHYGSAVAGVGSATILGLTLTQFWIVTPVAAAVIVGALIVRARFRRNQRPED